MQLLVQMVNVRNRRILCAIFFPYLFVAFTQHATYADSWTPSPWRSHCSVLQPCHGRFWSLRLYNVHRPRLKFPVEFFHHTYYLAGSYHGYQCEQELKPECYPQEEVSCHTMRQSHYSSHPLWLWPQSLEDSNKTTSNQSWTFYHIRPHFYGSVDITSDLELRRPPDFGSRYDIPRTCSTLWFGHIQQQLH